MSLNTSYIILDRDGVINHDSDAYIKSPEEWQPIPGSLEAIAKLNRFGFRPLIVTNQSGIARGYLDLPTLDLIHEKFVSLLASVGGYVEEIFFCPHHPDENCICRKPKPGLIREIQAKYTIDLSATYFIGDTLTDVQAAKAAGCLPLLVLTGKGKRSLLQYPELREVPRFHDLAEAVEHVLVNRVVKDDV